LFTAYLRKKTGEISELRGLLRGLEERDAEPPSDKQLDQLFDIVSRSQQVYRDLIDSFDDILMAVSIDGRIRAVNSMFCDLVETPREGIYITTPEGRILDANPALVRMLGYESKEDLLKRQVSEILVDPAERKVLQQQVETQPMVQGREITLLRKDGSSIVCMNSATAVRDAGGKVVRYQGAVMDITERREMEHRLHQQQEFARRLVDNFRSEERRVGKEG